MCAVKQEIDRNEDMLRSCLRAVDALAKMPNAQQVSEGKGKGAGEGGWLTARGSSQAVFTAELSASCFASAGSQAAPTRPVCVSQVAPFKQFLDSVVMGPLLKVRELTAFGQ